MSKFQSIFLERLLLTLEGEADPSPPERGGRPSDIVNPPAAGGGEGGADTLRKQDYKKTRPMLKATRLKAEAKKTAPGIKEVSLVLGAILVFLLACYAFFYLNLSEEVDLDLDQDEN
ncbi:triple QxxK/R motif-containing protein isoform X1 [Rhineura floridana]|uniref:triple QxxK/R motif-containing protein isoform X1 n=1 Tax=Rhineura floridana TaxID=261503 RepID=UPI002AC822B6|nr:triple QxxK/R motif-containing protein isoform X1 [Rhineura floridana]